MKLSKWVENNKSTSRANPDRKVWFGKYKGYEVKDIPTSYLSWYVGNYEDQERTNLRRFERRAYTIFSLELRKRVNI